MIIFRGAIYVEARKPDLVDDASNEKFLKEMLVNAQKADRRVEQIMDQLPRSAKLVRTLRDKFGAMWVGELDQWERYANAHAQVGSKVVQAAKQLRELVEYMQRVGKSMDMLLTQSHRFTKQKFSERELAIIDEISQLTGGTLVTL